MSQSTADRMHRVFREELWGDSEGQQHLLLGAALGSVWLTGLLRGVCCTGVRVVDDPLTGTWLAAFLPTADGVDKHGGRGLDSTWRESVNGK